MGLFSRGKDVAEQDDATGNKVPGKLPDTVLDKLASKDKGVKSSNVVEKKDFIDMKRIPDEIANHQEERFTKIEPKHEPVVEENIPKINIDDDAVYKEHSFFSRLGNIFSKHDSEMHTFNSKELIGKMKEYHDSVKTGHEFFLHENDVEAKYRKKVKELNELEAQWMMRKKELDSAEMYLIEKEQQVELKIEELQKLVGSANRFKMFNTKCPEEKAFHLKSGQSVHSIQELLYYLPRMDDETFRHHVSETRNDFSLWIKYVFGSEKLAEHILFCSSRKDLIEKLKSY